MKCSARRGLRPGAEGSPPEEGLLRPLAQEVCTPAVAMSSESAVRVTHELAGSIVEVAEDVAAPRRDVVDNPALVLITGDIGRRIRRGLALQLVNELGHRGRDRRRV